MAPSKLTSGRLAGLTAAPVLVGLILLGAIVLAGFQTAAFWWRGPIGLAVRADLTSVICAALVVAALALRRRAVRIQADVWPLMLLGVGIIAGSGLAGQVVAALDEARPDQAVNPATTLIFRIGCLLACVPFYQALIHWNRSRIGTIDPGESINGLSGLLAMIALGSLALPHFRHRSGVLTILQLQASLWSAAALFILFGTAMSVLFIAGLLADPRIWLIVAGFGMVLVEQWAALIAGSAATGLSQALWLLTTALISLCVLIPPQLGGKPADKTTTQGTIFGALTVLLACLAILAVIGEVGGRPNRLAIGYLLVAAFGGTMRLLRLVQDLTQLAQTRHEALTDELTGLANRRALLAALEDELPNARQASLLIIDLDRFKAVNDRYGHDAGDQVLRHMADAFSAHIPAGGLLARLGGDEFAVLLIDVPPDSAAQVARSLAAAAAPLSDVKGQILQVGASVGVASQEAPGLRGAELLRQADTAMYLAKTTGSGVRHYDSEVDALAQSRLDLIEDLHLALDGPAQHQGQIIVYFQPQMAARTGRVSGAEALVRWAHPRLGLLEPDLFIDLAEKNELMMSLTTRVMHETIVQAARWRAAGYPLRASVNLSASCLANPMLLTLVEQVLDAGMPATDLVLEVTETSLMKDPEQALAAINQIAARGVGISIDDYGTGYCSLSYLNDLPATELKIDKTFTARTTSNPRTAAIVAGTVELAHRLGMRLIAEGVEDDETLGVMVQLGCDETQGYLHSQPLPADLFLDWLAAHSGLPATPDPAPEMTSDDAGQRQSIATHPN